MRHYPVLARLSAGCPDLKGRLPTCYSPVRHSLHLAVQSVRLACVKHAASVRSEPESNSPVKFATGPSSETSRNAYFFIVRLAENSKRRMYFKNYFLGPNWHILFGFQRAKKPPKPITKGLFLKVFLLVRISTFVSKRWVRNRTFQTLSRDYQHF